MKKDIEKFKEMWYSRNPVHKNNLDTGEDMFWDTAELVAREYVEYITQQPLSDFADVTPELFDTMEKFAKDCEKAGNVKDAKEVSSWVKKLRIITNVVRHPRKNK